MTSTEILKKYFGYSGFRDGQADVVDSIMQGRDTLAIMPTGAGKSICYQVPALMKSGITLVISPLISLMHDQVISLKSAGIAGAYINSTLSPMQVEKALYNASKGLYKIIYVAPERLQTPQFIDFARSVEISMVTIDEAHCISQWGQDFRPSYEQIPLFINMLDKRPIVSAFTATATEQVKQDIIQALQLKSPSVKVTGFDRKNLFFEVIRQAQKDNTLIELLNQYKNKSGIIYCTTRKTVEEVCENVAKRGYSVTRYHAGLPQMERNKNQTEFINDNIKIMVATNAFGMGIDKSNVNFVIHYNTPKDLESYYQEAGRAGRDGMNAKCILLYNKADISTIKWMIENDDDIEKEVDYEVQELLKKREYERLNIMTGYATTDKCLRQYILQYFGEQSSDDCGNCSNCQSQLELTDVTEESKCIISCVLELNERFGMGMIMDILTGSKRREILDRHLDEVTSYNKLKTSKSQIKFIADNLVTRGYLAIESGQYPIVKLTSQGREFLMFNERIEMKVQINNANSKKSKTQQQTAALSQQEQLFELLRQKRGELARGLHVPAYVVFADKTLQSMCEILPKNKSQMLEVSSVGEVKFEKFGEIFIQLITEYCNQYNIG